MSHGSEGMVELSVVIAVYNEDPRNLLRVVERLGDVISPLGLSHEVVFVNDGSNPATSDALRRVAIQIDNVKLIELSRNFGQQAAITAGLDHADGLAVVNIDSDLQDPPELIPEMVRLWRQGYEVVYAQRSTRRDRLTKRLSAFLFYRLLGLVSSVKIPFDSGDYRLIDRKVVQALRALPEKTRFLRGMVPWLGFKQIGIPIDRGAREVGASAYTLRKLLQLAADGLLAFSVAPLYLIPVIGAFVLAVALAATAGCLIWGGGLHALGATHLIALALLAAAGVQILCTGLVAVYMSKILEEVRARPTYIVSERIGFQSRRSHGAVSDPTVMLPRGDESAVTVDFSASS